MSKLWVGRTAGKTEKIADEFNSSIGFDQRMYREDIMGSLAHAAMLLKAGILSEEEEALIGKGLGEILSELDAGSLSIDSEAEDIHMFIEEELTKRIGAPGKKLHTARSRNDQVALDLRLYLRKECAEIIGGLSLLTKTVTDISEEHIDFVMPGYTHMQRAQPILFSHHLMAYAGMFMRDIERVRDAAKRMNVSPIGACALAGTTYNTDRFYEGGLLGFDDIGINSIDSVSDRDFCMEIAADLCMVMMHLSRLSEELILWSGAEFRFVELSDGFTTGSSIMPQKKNPDMAELIRGKTGRVYGDLMALLVTFKGLPLAYNKDMQEDKEAIFDAVDTVKMCLPVMTGMLSSMKVHGDRMLLAAEEGFINATDLADYLVMKGLPFRDAYRISGEIVRDAAQHGRTLSGLSLEEYLGYSPLFEKDVYEAVDLLNCVERRSSYGGTSRDNVEREIESARGFLGKIRNMSEECENMNSKEGAETVAQSAGGTDVSGAAGETAVSIETAPASVPAPAGEGDVGI